MASNIVAGIGYFQWRNRKWNNASLSFDNHPSSQDVRWRRSIERFLSIVLLLSMIKQSLSNSSVAEGISFRLKGDALTMNFFHFVIYLNTKDLSGFDQNSSDGWTRRGQWQVGSGCFGKRRFSGDHIAWMRAGWCDIDVWDFIGRLIGDWFCVFRFRHERGFAGFVVGDQIIRRGFRCWWSCFIILMIDMIRRFSRSHAKSNERAYERC